MGRLSHIIHMGPKCNHRCPYKREEEEDLIHTKQESTWRQSRERFEDTAIEKQSDADTSQRMLAAIKNERRQRMNVPPCTSGGIVAQWYDFRLLVSRTVKE